MYVIATVVNLVDCQSGKVIQQCYPYQDYQDLLYVVHKLSQCRLERNNYTVVCCTHAYSLLPKQHQHVGIGLAQSCVLSKPILIRKLTK